jgi:hypothetical protein
MFPHPDPTWPPNREARRGKRNVTKRIEAYLALGLPLFIVLALLIWGFPHPPEWLFWPVILVALVSLGWTFRVRALLEDHAGTIKKLKEETLVLQGQVTAQHAIMTNVINALEDGQREALSKPFKAFLGKRLGVNPSPLSEEDKNTFNQAFSMTMLAITEEIKPPKSE